MSEGDAPAAAAAPRPKPPASEHREDGTFSTVRESLQGLAQEARMPPPDDDLVRRVIAAAEGATGEQIHIALTRLWKSGQLSRMRGWGFILIKLADCARQGVA
jgi:hypothetical protein